MNESSCPLSSYAKHSSCPAGTGFWPQMASSDPVRDGAEEFSVVRMKTPKSLAPLKLTPKPESFTPVTVPWNTLNPGQA